MKLNISGVNINVEYNPDDNEKINKIFFLHGFTGSSKEWENILPDINNSWQKISVDLIGHGKSEAPAGVEHYTVSSICSQLNEIIKHFTGEKIVLAGYSMGGRVALAFGAEYPEKVKGLIIESGTTGIYNEDKRLERIKNDEELAQLIENNPIEKFIEYWMDRDLFNTQRRFSNQRLEGFKKEKLNNSKTGLANSLRGFGTGTMTGVSDKLKKEKIKILFLTGELDTKFTNINIKLVKYLPTAKHKIIRNSGHNIHLEEPRAYTEAVNRFIEKL